jgi:hypothetical protein
MQRHNLSKKIGTIQIDVDGLWVIFQHFGVDYQEPTGDVMYESSLPRFLDLFDLFNIKATLFVVGKDLFSASKVALLKEALKRGHEIANHTMSHREGFSFLSFDEKKREIEDAEHIIQDKLGVTTKGFRTPSNDVDADVLRILESRNYLYDSSLLPTFYGPWLKKLKLSSLKITRKDHYLGRAIYGFSSLAPYHPCNNAVWKKGNMKIVEVPITTMPVLRMPFHMSFNFAMYHLGFGCGLFNLGYMLLNMTSLPLNFVFHTNELSDSIHIKKIKRQFGLSLPLETKQRICNQVLTAIKKNFNIVTTAEFVRILDTKSMMK